MGCVGGVCGLRGDAGWGLGRWQCRALVAEGGVHRGCVGSIRSICEGNVGGLVGAVKLNVMGICYFIGERGRGL